MSSRPVWFTGTGVTEKKVLDTKVYSLDMFSNRGIAIYQHRPIIPMKHFLNRNGPFDDFKWTPENNYRCSVPHQEYLLKYVTFNARLDRSCSWMLSGTCNTYTEHHWCAPDGREHSWTACEEDFCHRNCTWDLEMKSKTSAKTCRQATCKNVYFSVHYVNMTLQYTL